MAKRLVLWLAVLVLLGVAIVMAVPASRYTALGMINREQFYENRPFSYWLRALQDHNPKVRKQAAFALGTMSDGNPAAAPDLARALSDDDTIVRLNAALALYKMGPHARAALPQLCAALKDPEVAVRMNAAMALSRLGPEATSAVPAVIEALADPDNRVLIQYFHRTVREQLVYTLGRIGPAARDARPVLAAALKDEDERMRVAAADAIGRINPDGAGQNPAEPGGR